MRVENEDSAFMSEAADQLMPFGGLVKSIILYDSPGLVAQNVTLIFSVSSSSEDEEDCVRGSITLFLCFNSTLYTSCIE
jgi:hypothetical protein